MKGLSNVFAGMVHQTSGTKPSECHDATKFIQVKFITKELATSQLDVISQLDEHLQPFNTLRISSHTLYKQTNKQQQNPTYSAHWSQI